MFTKKDRKIANQKAMIENRDKFIDRQVKEYQELKEENIAVHSENKDLRFEIEELKDTLREVLKLAESNTYNNDKIVLSKIIEVIRRQTK